MNRNTGRVMAVPVAALVLLLTATVPPGAATAQNTNPLTVAAPPGMVSRERARQAASAFLRRCGLGRSAPPLNIGYYSIGSAPPVYEVHWPDYEVTVEAATGTVMRLTFHRRIWERARGAIHAPRLAIQTPAQAQERLNYFARRIGLPPGAYLKGLNRNVWKDGNATGRFTVRLPGGYPALGSRPGMTLSLDRRDGALLSFGQEWRFVVTGSARRLDRAQAVARATALYEATARQNGSLRTGGNRLPLSGAVLAYVIPQNRARPNEVPRPLRLAWIVQFGKPYDVRGRGYIWVDASDGALLGSGFTR